MNKIINRAKEIKDINIWVFLDELNTCNSIGLLNEIICERSIYGTKLPDNLKSGYRTNEVKNYSHVYKRLHRNKPAHTMVPGHNAFPVHPVLNRTLTVREAARIQTFPDEIIFQGNRQEQCIQVGNAFPPMLAEILANNIKKAEINNWYPNEVSASAWYSLLEKQNFENPVLELF